MSGFSCSKSGTACSSLAERSIAISGTGSFWSAIFPARATGQHKQKQDCAWEKQLAQTRENWNKRKKDMRQDCCRAKHIKQETRQSARGKKQLSKGQTNKGRAEQSREEWPQDALCNYCVNSASFFFAVVFRHHFTFLTLVSFFRYHFLFPNTETKGWGFYRGFFSQYQINKITIQKWKVS